MTLNALAIDVMLPALPQMAQSLHVVNENDRHWVVLAYALGFGVAQLAFGPLSDRFGRRVPMFAGVAVYAAASLSCKREICLGRYAHVQTRGVLTSYALFKTRKAAP